MESPRFRICLLGGLSVRPLHDADAPPVTRFTTQKTAALLALLALSPGRRFPREALIDRLWTNAALNDGRCSLRVALAALRRVLEPTGAPSGAILLADRESVTLRAEAVTTDVADFEAAVQCGDEETARRLYAAGPFLPAFYDDWAIQVRNRLEETHERLDAAPSRRIAIAVAVAAPPAQTTPSDLPRDPRERLPFYLTRFVGRETERETLTSLWYDDANRLITITGTGGVGKTRFVRETLAAPSTGAPRVLRFAPLVDADDTAAMIRRVAVTLERDPAKADAQTLGNALHALGRTRLALDNLEQLLPGGADVIAEWLTACPNLQIVVTSRQRLNIPGEHEFALQPLATPTLPATPERLLDFASVRLFLDRARLARPDAVLTPRTAETLAALCERLGGLPLALEITAAWAGALTFRQMLSRVEARLLDETGPPAAHKRAARPERHRTLRAALDVSLELLSPALRRSFADLAVFRGGFTADATCAVLGAESGSHETLSRLRERSLLVAEADAERDTLRFHLLPAIYEYARERHEADAARVAELDCAHSGYFLGLAEASRDDETALDPDVENFRHALDTAETVSHCDDLRLCAALWSFWKVRGYAKEGLELLERAIKRQDGAPPEESALCALQTARHGAGALAFDLCQWDDARRHHEAALALAQSLSDAAATGRAYQGLAAIVLHADTDLPRATEFANAARAQYRLAGDIVGEAGILITRGVIANRSGDYAQALTFQRESLALAETTGDRQRIATAHHRIGNSLVRLERYDDAEAHFAAALDCFRAIGNCMDAAFTLSDRATIAYYKNDLAQAVAFYEESLPLLRALGETWAISVCLNNVGRIATDTGEWGRAVTFLSEALELRARLGDKHALLQSVDAVINLLVCAAAPDNKKSPRPPFAREAVQLRAADVALRAALGIGQATAPNDALTAKLAEMRRALGEQRCARLESAGATLTLSDAVVAAQNALAQIL